MQIHKQATGNTEVAFLVVHYAYNKISFEANKLPVYSVAATFLIHISCIWFYVNL